MNAFLNYWNFLYLIVNQLTVSGEAFSLREWNAGQKYCSKSGKQIKPFAVSSTKNDQKKISI